MDVGGSLNHKVSSVLLSNLEHGDRKTKEIFQNSSLSLLSYRIVIYRIRIVL